MKRIQSPAELSQILAPLREQNLSIGLVPTMGALHEGHASLVMRSVKENDVTVVSLFVNPTQFNDPRDLQRYPRTPEADEALLSSLNVDILFAPEVCDIYPEPDLRIFSYPPVDTVMEGARRPGHFNGVCQIVSKLFGYVLPDRAYFGEKDFQQIAVVRKMVEDLQFPLEIIPCPIVREPSGLALSSRNALLSDEERILAAHIYATLRESVQYAMTHSVVDTHNFVVETINQRDGLEVEYYEIVEGSTLQSVKDWSSSETVGCITVYCGEKRVRMIDNIRYTR